MFTLERALVFARGFLLSYGPMKIKKALWNKEFSAGKWDFIDDTSNDCVYSHLERHAHGGDILDLGCGPGNTANELARDAYRSYIGVDISESAIEKGINRTNENSRSEKNRFVCSDFLGYMPTQDFDVILFRESLYHVPQGRVQEILEKYSKHLKPSGVFIVRLYSGDFKTGRIKYRVWKKLDLIGRNYDVVESFKYETPGLPTVLIFRPRTAKSTSLPQESNQANRELDPTGVQA
jgi:SAM-dependent methyltransferase